MPRRGRGVVNALINRIPFEAHIPGYNFCGPGTKLQERLRRGDRGINLLDEACREHDIAYAEHKNLASRHEADRILQERAWHRVKSGNASIGERAAAWAVTTAMKTKRKLGMGIKKRRRVPFKGGLLKSVLAAVKNVGPLPMNLMIKTALAAAKKFVKGVGGKEYVQVPRTIPVPKQGGILPLLVPLFAGLSAAGALAGGASGIAKAVNDAKAARKQLDETERHNKTMEAIALGKRGSALYMYKRGKALYLKPYSKN